MSTARKTEHNTRIYDKRQACYSGKKLFPKIHVHVAPHYQAVHARESEMVKALAFPVKSTERNLRELERLRLLGNFHHNTEVLRTKCCSLIEVRCHIESEAISPDEFQPCTHCYGFVWHNELWWHNKTCSFKKIKERGEDEGEEHRSKKLTTTKQITLAISEAKSVQSSLMRPLNLWNLMRLQLLRDMMI